MVVYDDTFGLCFPMGWDCECEGAIEASEKPVIFPNRAAAQRAIRISRKWAALRKEQGVIISSDFDPLNIKYVRIWPVNFA